MFDLVDVNSRAEQALVKNMSNPEGKRLSRHSFVLNCNVSLTVVYFSCCEESRQIYLEEIMDWTDNYTENKLDISQSDEAKRALSTIVKLWIAFCTMEISLRQFKQAVKIFEDAIIDPIASRSADIYLAYIEYCKTRGKLANAQKVYIKGLSASLLQEEADKLWRSFLPFIQSQGSPNLTMSQLYEAVRNEAGVDSLTPPGSSATEEGLVRVGSEPTTDTALATQLDSTHSNNNSNTSQNPVDTEASSRMNVEESFVDAECKTEDASQPSSSIDTSAQHSVDTDEGIVIKQEKGVPKIVENESAAKEGQIDIPVKGEDDSKMCVLVDDVLTVPAVANVLDTFVNPGGAGDDLDLVAGMTPEQLTRIHRLRPPMLFSAPNKEPTVFGLSPLSSTDIAELEAFLGVGLTSIRYGVRQGKADTYLDIVEGLWTAQALKERHFDSWFTDLKKLHEKEVKRSTTRHIRSDPIWP